MNLKQYIPRLLIFFIGLPLILLVPIFLPFYNQLAVCVVTVVMSGLGSIEFARMHKARGIFVSEIFAFLTGTLMPISAYFILQDLLPKELPMFALIILVLGMLTTRIFVKNEEEVAQILPEITAWMSVIVYPSLLTLFIIKLGSMEHSTLLLLSFFAMTFGNDSFAWFFGVFFGKKRKIFIVSPNKSIAGFIGGSMTSVIALSVFAFLFPNVFRGPIFIWSITGFFVGCGAILGDLSESALKRSAKTKDSGDIIPGRGGVLDSIDSLIFAAPVYYYLYYFITMYFI